MLRRKLLVRIGLLIGAFVVGAVIAIGFLQDALSEIDRTNHDATALIDGVQSIEGSLIAIEAAALEPKSDRPGPSMDEAARRLNTALAELGSHRAVQGPAAPGAPAYERLRAMLPGHVEFYADPSRSRTPEALASSMAAHAGVQDLGTALRSYVGAEQLSLGRCFRALVLGLTLAALVMVNVAVFVLLHTSQVVLKPVAALVEGSRELAAERFDHRVMVDQDDEFGELARAYNLLAVQLQSNEERKAETLRQLAVTLNHDLNNALAVIEMQLGLLDRQTGGNPAQARHLHEIRAVLARMSGTIASLKNIRRVVLTDYGPGQKMLDLERSVDPGPFPAPTREHAA